MRYLFGDSVPFPPQYDFLAALEVFCTQAARVVRLEAESRALALATEEGAAGRVHGVDELEAFHREAVGALEDGATGSAQGLVRDYVHQVGDLAKRLVDDARRQAIQTNDREQQQLRVEQERRRVEVREALEKLLVAVSLPTTETHVTMTLEQGKPELSAVFAYDGALRAGFTLAADDLEAWRAPRHVRDFAQQLSLPVGVRRSLFKRTVAPETIALDEYVVGGFELRDDRAELRLRKKPETPDSLVFRLARADGRVVAEVHHPDDAEAESGLPTVLDAASTADVERFWRQLRAACAPLLARKKRMVRLTSGEGNVVESDLGTQVVTLVVGAIAPVVQELARRSPNAHELSLKVENDSGRREEIYLRKAQLVSALSAVMPRERIVFDPLGLIASGPRESIESLPDDALLPA